MTTAPRPALSAETAAPGGGPRDPRPGAGPAARAARLRPRRRGYEAVSGWLFVAPAVVLFAVMGLYTVGYGFLLSFAQWNGFAAHWTWVGIQNYKDLLWADPRYAPRVQHAALHTLYVMLAVPALTVLVSFPLAVLLNSARRMQTLLRSVYFVPYVTSGIAVFFAWQYILQPDGAINTLLKSVGMGSLSQPQGWLGNPHTALPTMIVVTVWGAVPVAMLMYLTGLQSIDRSVLEAAQLDGAGWWRTNFSVVWPLVRPITAIVVLLNLRDSLQGFQTFLVMTNGGPGDHTNVLGLEAYRLAFLMDLDPTLGLASALGWLLFAAALVIALINLRVLRSRT
ncbi:multiple sugar transport system permease protein/raffinose/stachyose/melibiose transport system permease protein [Actinacidiphila yanglinensis]|uniref:Multiple sugar transport system permease protein/raffinose/stachyose/melibiose transport system permease protein n=1 Tax=Actinacidiphila yanglinensis TaxID=310779 RepID=A0A1H5X3N0_9ACTN|nr:sugar ABC transporter permease [Actinacidiphila yanglinensis]SEG06372.1 multiple sugar transport system permease protein/raffinose/stachyose/melibiose transport system permease protein [Actinacidiphila yanglinensis]